MKSKFRGNRVAILQMFKQLNNPKNKNYRQK